MNPHPREGGLCKVSKQQNPQLPSADDLSARQDIVLQATAEALATLKANPSVFSDLQCHVLICALTPKPFHTIANEIKALNSKYEWLKVDFVAEQTNNLVRRGYLTVSYVTRKRPAISLEGTLTIDPDSGTITFEVTEERYIEAGVVKLLTLTGLPRPIPTTQHLVIRSGKPNWEPKQ